MKPVFSVLLFLVYQISYCQDTTGVGNILAKISAIENTRRHGYLVEVEKDTATKIDHVLIFTFDTTRQELIKVKEQWTNMQVRRRDSIRISKDTARYEFYFE